MKPLMVIAGAGQTGRELAVRLLPGWRIVIVDKNQRKLDILDQEGASSEITRLLGDATSTLVLRSAGIESAHAAVAVMGWDEANLEFCRLARDLFRVPRILSMTVLRSQLPRFEELGVEVICRPYSVASALQSRLETGKRTTSDVGLGMGELFDVRVLPHSPAIGKALADLHPQSWLVGAIYRKGTLVVPHGSTLIEEGDRVLLIGQPEILPAIADYFRSGMSEFPLQYGTRILVVNPDGRTEGRSVDEAFYLARNTRAFGVKLVLASGQEAATLEELCGLAEVDCSVVDPAPEEDEDGEMDLEALLTAQDCGCLVTPAPQVGFLERLGMGGGGLLGLLDQARQPCLVARGSYPYRRILVAVAPGGGPSRALELALDVARLFEASVTACAVQLPDFVSGEQRNRDLQRALEHAVAVGTFYSVKVEPRLLQGNPVHRVLEAAADFDLLVLAHRRLRAFSLVQTDVSRHLLVRAPCSVMVLPYGKGDFGGR